MNTRQANALAKSLFGPHAYASARRGWREIIISRPNSLCCLLLGRARCEYIAAWSTGSRTAANRLAWAEAFDKAAKAFASIAPCELCDLESTKLTDIEGVMCCTSCAYQVAS